MSTAPADRFYRREPLALLVWYNDVRTSRVLTLRWTYDLTTPSGRPDDFAKLPTFSASAWRS